MRHRFLLAAPCLLLALAPPAARASGERLTLDWIFSPEGKTAASVPDAAWLDDGQLVIYDSHPAPAERTLESVDPDTGARRRLVDPKVALADLARLVKPKESIEELGWPDAIDPRGGWAAYERDDAVLLLELATSKFVRLGGDGSEAKSPRFSPDGTRLAYVRDHDLRVLDLASREETALTEGGSDTLLHGTVSWVYWEEIFGRVDTGYAWAPDSRSIAYLETDEAGVDLTTFVDDEPSVPRVLHQRYPMAGDANPRVRAGVVDLATRRTTWIDLGAYPYEYLARLSWLPDGRRLAVETLDRPQTTLDLFFADAATGGVTHVLREIDPGWVNLNDDLRFLDDGRRFLWLSERDGHAHLYLYDLDGTLVRQVTRGDWAVHGTGAVAWDRGSVVRVDEPGGWVTFSALEKSSIEQQLYRVRLDGTGMERITRGDGTHRVSFSPDGRVYLDAWSAIDRLPSLTVHLPTGELRSTVAAARPKLLERFDLLPRQLFSIAAADGFPMPAMLLRPRGFDAHRRYPVVLTVYGGPSAPTVANAWAGGSGDYYEELLAEEGFAVLRVDNRAATARSKTLENLILRDGYGRTELGDLLDAVRWLKAQPWVDPDRVGIWGWSGGGDYTLLAMTSSKEFRAGVAVAPVTDWHDYDTKWTEAFMKRPQDDPEGYERTSRVAQAADLHGRLLLVYGTHDDNVHPQNAQRFADALIKAGITFDLMVYPMRKHDIGDDAARKHLYRTMLEFWERNLR